MTNGTEATVIEAVDCSVIETVEAFVRFRPGFHGDTGIRDYLYHRLMTNLPNSGRHTCSDGHGTLLAQAEWYTQLMYRHKGEGPSPGRFDIGIPKLEELSLPKPHALVAFECGRNKRASSLLRDVDATAEHEGPQSGDITKLVREISHKQLPYGYALEFFDKGRGAEATDLIDHLRERICKATSDSLRVAVVACAAGKNPVLTFLPGAWDERIRLRFRQNVTRIEDLRCAGKPSQTAEPRSTRRYHGNRVTREDFLSSCSTETCALINDIEHRLGSRVKMVFGAKTMTVNHQPRGKMLRVSKDLNCVEDLDPAVDHHLASILQPGVRSSRYEIKGTGFRDAVVHSLARLLET